MTDTPTLEIPERGHTDISTTDWDEIRSDSSFLHLIDAGILSASISGDRIRLSASCYVGSASCRKTNIRVTEKIPGALAALLHYSAYSAFRIEKVPAPSSKVDELIALLIRQFLEAVAAYAAKGRQFKYASQKKVGSLAGGRLDVHATLQLRARGLGHLLASRKDALDYKTPLNRLVLAALREVDRLSAIVDLPIQDVSEARGLAMLFSDCRDAQILYGGRSQMLAEVDRALSQMRDQEQRDICSLAGVILANQSFNPNAYSASAVPRSWYLNLERLFESSARLVLDKVLGEEATVTGPSSGTAPIFADRPEEFRANPDLIVKKAGSVVAIGDVKYKDWAHRALVGDIYQLLAHAEAFHSNLAFLVYPYDQYVLRYLGTSGNSIQVWIIAVDVRELPRDLAALATDLGLLEKETN